MPSSVGVPLFGFAPKLFRFAFRGFDPAVCAASKLTLGSDVELSSRAQELADRLRLNRFESVLPADDDASLLKLVERLAELRLLRLRQLERLQKLTVLQ